MDGPGCSPNSQDDVAHHFYDLPPTARLVMKSTTNSESVHHCKRNMLHSAVTFEDPNKLGVEEQSVWVQTARIVYIEEEWVSV